MIEEFSIDQSALNRMKTGFEYEGKERFLGLIGSSKIEFDATSRKAKMSLGLGASVKDSKGTVLFSDTFEVIPCPPPAIHCKFTFTAHSSKVEFQGYEMKCDMKVEVDAVGSSTCRETSTAPVLAPLSKRESILLGAIEVAAAAVLVVCILPEVVVAAAGAEAISSVGGAMTFNQLLQAFSTKQARIRSCTSKKCSALPFCQKGTQQCSKRTGTQPHYPLGEPSEGYRTLRPIELLCWCLTEFLIV